MTTKGLLRVDLSETGLHWFMRAPEKNRYQQTSIHSSILLGLRDDGVVTWEEIEL